MSLINDFKHELINQKNLLESKGVIVNTANEHPSIGEITTAIDNFSLNIDTTITTATPEDVMKGKTFYSGNTDLKVGTFDTSILRTLQENLNTLVTGVGKMEIYIPTDTKYNRIREYSYGIYSSNTEMFYKENLVIPPNIQEIGSRGFYKCNITGPLVIPATCKAIDSSAFQYTNISQLDVYGGLSSIGSYIFSNCPQLKKIFLHAPTKSVGGYSLANNENLEELYLPDTMTSFASSSLNNCPKLKLVKFTADTPFSIPTGLFASKPLLNFLVPYNSYHEYFTATNYQYYSTPQYGYGEFSKGMPFPTRDVDNLYNITWHPTFEDALARTNTIDTCPESGTYYSVFNEIDSTIDDTTT